MGSGYCVRRVPIVKYPCCKYRKKVRVLHTLQIWLWSYLPNSPFYPLAIKCYVPGCRNPPSFLNSFCVLLILVSPRICLKYLTMDAKHRTIYIIRTPPPSFLFLFFLFFWLERNSGLPWIMSFHYSYLKTVNHNIASIAYSILLDGFWGHYIVSLPCFWTNVLVYQICCSQSKYFSMSYWSFRSFP